MVSYAHCSGPARLRYHTRYAEAASPLFRVSIRRPGAAGETVTARRKGGFIGLTPMAHSGSDVILARGFSWCPAAIPPMSDSTTTDHSNEMCAGWFDVQPMVTAGASRGKRLLAPLLAQGNGPALPRHVTPTSVGVHSIAPVGYDCRTITCVRHTSGKPAAAFVG